MIQAFGLQQSSPTVSYRDMKTALGKNASNLPDTRAVVVARRLVLRRVFGTVTGGTKVVAAAHRGLARGRRVEQERNSSEFTQFDGGTARTPTQCSTNRGRPSDASSQGEGAREAFE